MDEQSGGRVPPPPIDFRLLCESFASQAMCWLGKMPHPESGETEVDLAWARYFIDSLGMLDAKTREGISKEERSFLDARLSMLRLTYLETHEGAAREGDPEAGDSEAGGAAE